MYSSTTLLKLKLHKHVLFLHVLPPSPFFLSFKILSMFHTCIICSYVYAKYLFKGSLFKKENLGKIRFPLLYVSLVLKIYIQNIYVKLNKMELFTKTYIFLAAFKIGAVFCTTVGLGISLCELHISTIHSVFLKINIFI